MRFTKLFLAFLLITASLSIRACFQQPDGKLHVYFLNVGQGDAIYIRGPQGADILIDGGPDNSVLSKLGRKMDFYDHQLDLLILTHPDSDHLTGLIEILKRYQINRVVTTGAVDDSPECQAWLKMIGEKKIPVSLVKQGSRMIIDKAIDIQVLYPHNYLLHQELENSNSGSLVLRLSYGRVDFLFTGDAEEEAGRELLQNNTNLEAEIFKVSHHGSRNGLGNQKEVLEKIKPQWAVISVGKNRYGHPNKAILELLKQNNIQYLRTDTEGTIEVETDGQHYKIKSS